MTDSLLALTLFAAVFVGWAVLRRVMHVVIVESHEAVLLVRNGRDGGRLSPGVHRFFFGHVWTACFDLREALLSVTGQEVLTSDRVPVKLSVVARYRVDDAELVHRSVQDVLEHVHAETQLSLRAVVAALSLDDLLDDRAAASAQVADRLRSSLADVGVVLVDASLRDVMVTGDLKRALGDVARARAEGLAKLERARGEAAALRKLANAARLLREHEGLDRLRTLEIAERAASSSQNTLSFGLESPRAAQ
ncbi:MAG: slipin family protein [Planctomycetota bacterium]